MKFLKYLFTPVFIFIFVMLVIPQAFSESTSSLQNLNQLGMPSIDQTGTMHSVASEQIPAKFLVAGAYGFIWAAVCVFVGNLAWRYRKLAQKIQKLQEKIEAKHSEDV